MISLEFNQEMVNKEDRLSDHTVKEIVNQVNENVPDLPSGNIEASFVSDNEMQRLNRMYRGQDKVTDVLSFSYAPNIRFEKGLGDIVISHEQAKRQMLDDDLKLEIADLLIHGILHVLGYDHEKPEDAKEMFSLQDKILAIIWMKLKILLKVSPMLLEA